MFCIVYYKILIELLTAIWKSRNRHLGIGIGVSIGIDIGITVYINIVSYTV